MKAFLLLCIFPVFLSLPSFGAGVDDQWINVELWTASSLLDQPESLFGHSFLRVQTKNNPQGFVIQFVAGLREGEEVSYVKGITGSYPVKLQTRTATSYIFETLKASRGLKKIKLRLSRDEVHSLQLVYHWLSEQQSKLGKYYFFSKNCAQAILDYFSFARIEMRKALLKGKVPSLLADTFIDSSRAQGPEVSIFDLSASRHLALQSLAQGRPVEGRERLNMVLWFIADRSYINEKKILPQVYRALPRYNSQTIKEAVSALLAE